MLCFFRLSFNNWFRWKKNFDVASGGDIRRKSIDGEKHFTAIHFTYAQIAQALQFAT